MALLAPQIYTVTPLVVDIQASGDPDIDVVITGLNFTAGTVAFAGVTALVTVADNNTLLRAFTIAGEAVIDTKIGSIGASTVIFAFAVAKA